MEIFKNEHFIQDSKKSFHSAQHLEGICQRTVSILNRHFTKDLN